MPRRQTQNTSSVYHWMLGGVLIVTILFVIIAIVVINSQANDVTTSVTIGNVDPTVDTIFVSNSPNGSSNDFGAGIILYPGTTRTIHVNGHVSDENSVSDINDSSISVTFYQSSVSGGANCTPANNTCYVVAGNDCTLSNINATTRAYNCPVPMHYYANNTQTGTYAADDWLVSVTVTDNSGPSSASLGTTSGVTGIEVNSLVALSIPDMIDYGTIELGNETSNTNNMSMIIGQAGNEIADVEVSSATDMTCTIGTIPVANQKWSVEDVGFSDEGAVSLSGTETNANLDVPQRITDEENPTKVLYWNILIPHAVGGTCTGTSVISAIAGS